MRFPKHKCGLSLTHNAHKNVYETLEQYLDRPWYEGGDSWVSPEQKQKAIDTDSLWELQWYPDTPVGFYTLMAAELDILLDAANKDD